MNVDTQLANIKCLCENLDYEIFQDEILMENAKIGAQHYRIDLSLCTPTFLLKVDESFLVVIIQGNRKLDFKKLKKYLGSQNVRMANKDEIKQICHAPIGSVSLLNPQLRTLIDANVQALQYCYGGCGVEKYTLKINANDLIRITKAELGDFSILREEQQ